jgi:hypothetical protein
MAEGEAEKISSAEMLTAFSGAAVLANKFYVTLMSSGVRIAFTEQVGSEVPPQFRTSVILSFGDAILLTDLLKRMLAPVEETLAQAQKAASDKSDG